MADIHVNKLEENHYEDENEKLGKDDDNENNKICLMQKTFLSHCDLLFGIHDTFSSAYSSNQTLKVELSGASQVMSWLLGTVSSD